MQNLAQVFISAAAQRLTLGCMGTDSLLESASSRPFKELGTTYWDGAKYYWGWGLVQGVLLNEKSFIQTYYQICKKNTHELVHFQRVMLTLTQHSFLRERFLCSSVSKGENHKLLAMCQHAVFADACQQQLSCCQQLFLAWKLFAILAVFLHIFQISIKP